MLDSTVILQDIEELLDDHFGHIQAAQQAQAEFEQQALAQTPSDTPANNHPIANFVADVFTLLMFSVLEERLAR